ncbi:MAG: hypothetical protein WC858_03490 [Parcubacteria group bacterium]|jgi:nanoRNase/pAp phosphatase (c-di-AMP/oligoRNAs hydrolase)
MTLSPKEQIKNQVESAEGILILVGEKAERDATAAAWGMTHLLESLGKKTTLLENYSNGKDLDFLKKPKHVEKEIKGARDFVLSFNTKYNKIIDFRTEDKDGNFEIYITPEKEAIDPRDFSFIPAKFKYDLIFILGCSDLEKLGDVKNKNSDLFFEVPVVNIDNSSTNENFGQINLIDITAPSVSEITAELSKSLWEKYLGKDIAQCYLAGIVSATSNFQSPKTAPRTFLTASWLIEKGANQHEIIKHLLKTNSFPFMKLWGRVMARLNWDEDLKLAWSLVSIEDFVQSRSNPQDLALILEKIKDNFSRGKIFAVLYSEKLDQSIAFVRNGDSESLKSLQKNLGGEIKGGNLEIVFDKKNILEAEKELLGKLK